jgi:hypothetical protein
MSLVFNDTATGKGVIQTIERRLSFNDGDISGSTALMKYFTSEVNITIDEMLGFLFPKVGPWQLDDSNQTDYPIITHNLVSGQRDYTFTVDGTSNVILDIYRVMVADSNGVFRDITPVDQQIANNNNNSDTTGFVDGQNLTGIPTKYDKTGNGIFLDLIPNYNRTGGLKVFINREATYFTTSDTTKKLGFAHLFHEYLAVRPAHIYASNKVMPMAVTLGNERLALKMAILEYFGHREKDVVGKLVPNVEDTR